MSSATVGIARPQVVNPPSGGVFGKPPTPPAVPEKKKKAKLGMPKEEAKAPKSGKMPAKSAKPMDPIAIMGGGKPKKEKE